MNQSLALILIVSLVSLTTALSTAHAMPSPLHVKPKSILNLKNSGIANGGQALDEFSLLGVSDLLSGSSERIVLNYGDRYGKVWKGEPGFFQVALDHSGKRVVIDLSQVTKTGIEPSQLKAALAKSKYVASTDMTMDPQDQTTNLTLVMKAPVEVHLSTVSGPSSQVIIELKGL